MPGPRDRRMGTARRARILAYWRAHATCCALCGEPIDTTSTERTRWSLDVDEIVPRHLGGDPEDLSNTRPTHAYCNRAAGARVTNSRRPTSADRASEAEMW